MGEQRGAPRDGWLAFTGLITAGLALPLAQSAWHGPEVAAILAVAAVCLLAGQRWAVAVIVIADLSLLPTVWPRAVLGPGGVSRLIAFATLVAIIPGVCAVPRAATVLTAMLGRTGTERAYRNAHLGLLVLGVFAVLAPLL
jgi:hypothetical protein